MVDLWVAIPFLASLVWLGMPHGAIDHLLFFRHLGRPMTLPALAGFIFVYLGIAGLMAAVWIAFPLFCSFALLLLTWVHWGEEELFYERAKGGQATGLFALCRGSYPMLLPLVGHPEGYLAVLNGSLALSGRAIPEGLAGLMLSIPLRLSILFAVMIITVFERWQHRHDSRWMAQTREGLFWSVLFLVLPPLVSVGLYFILGHSLRHIRLLGAFLGPPMTTLKGQIRWAVFYRWAAPFTLGGIFFVWAWFAWPQVGHKGIDTLVGSYLAVLWALTWPHAILTHWVFSGARLRLGEQ